MITSLIQIFWARSFLVWFVVSKLILLFTARGLSAQSSLKKTWLAFVVGNFTWAKLSMSWLLLVMMMVMVTSFQMVSWLAVVFYFCFRSWLSLPASVATSPRTPSSRRRPPTSICHSSGNAILSVQPTTLQPFWVTSGGPEFESRLKEFFLVQEVLTYYVLGIEHY